MGEEGDGGPMEGMYKGNDLELPTVWLYGVKV